MNNDNENLGKILRNRRTMLSLTLNKLASESGVSPSYLARVEKGERFPSARILRKIAKPLRFSKSELFAFAEYLSPSDYLSTQFAENGNGPCPGNLDPNIASALSQEPIEIQRAVFAILSTFKHIARGISQEKSNNGTMEALDINS